MKSLFSDQTAIVVVVKVINDNFFKPREWTKGGIQLRKDKPNGDYTLYTYENRAQGMFTATPAFWRNNASHVSWANRFPFILAVNLVSLTITEKTGLSLVITYIRSQSVLVLPPSLPIRQASLEWQIQHSRLNQFFHGYKNFVADMKYQPRNLNSSQVLTIFFIVYNLRKCIYSDIAFSLPTFE